MPIISVTISASGKTQIIHKKIDDIKTARKELTALKSDIYKSVKKLSEEAKSA